MQAAELKGQFDLLFFHPGAHQDVVFSSGEDWLEEQLWRNLKWIECDSLVRIPNDAACDGITRRVGNFSGIPFAGPSPPPRHTDTLVGPESIARRRTNFLDI